MGRFCFVVNVCCLTTFPNRMIGIHEAILVRTSPHEKMENLVYYHWWKWDPFLRYIRHLCASRPKSYAVMRELCKWHTLTNWKYAVLLLFFYVWRDLTNSESPWVHKCIQSGVFREKWRKNCNNLGSIFYYNGMFQIKGCTPSDWKHSIFLKLH